MASSPDQTIFVLNGPNLNMLGTREPEIYGHATLADVEKLCADTAAQFGLKADCRQSNREGELVDFIHEAHAKKAAGIWAAIEILRATRTRSPARSISISVRLVSSSSSASSRISALSSLENLPVDFPSGWRAICFDPKTLLGLLRKRQAFALTPILAARPLIARR